MRPLINRLMPTSVRLAATLLLMTGMAYAQTVTTVNLTAQRMSTTLPDGTTVPMWGYCTNDGVATNLNANLAGGTLLNVNPCSALPPGATVAVANTVWQPGPTIVIPTGNQLTIKLTNNLYAGISTSLVILGQVGGSAGVPTRDTVAIVHAPVSKSTWPTNAVSPTFTPPPQALRARAFAPEAVFSSTVSYTWNTNTTPTSATPTYLKPGTYLYETGSHPSLQAPMGLYGMLVVTNAPVYAVANAGMPAATQTLISPGHAYPGAYAGAIGSLAALSGVPYDADAKLLFSEIDSVQNAAVDAAAVARTSETLRFDDPQCLQSQKLAPIVGGVAQVQVSCYPAAVNYAPTFFLVNGRAYDQTDPTASSVALANLTGSASLSGNVLVRMVNAGSRTHVPSMVGLPLTLIAEDGNVAPGNPKVQNEVNMPAGKTHDGIVRPDKTTTSYVDRAYAFFDRALGLTTGNATRGGYQGYMIVAPASAVTSSGNARKTSLNNAIGANAKQAATAQANPDNYLLAPNATSFTNNVLTNDVGVISTVISGAAFTPGATSTTANLPHGSVKLNTNGTFTYNVTTLPTTLPVSDTFTYCGNGSATLCAIVTLTFEARGGVPVAAARTYDNSQSSAYTTNVASLLIVPRGAGLLVGAVDPSNHPLSATFLGVAPTWATLKPDGSFTATPCAPAPVTCTFQFAAVNSQGTASTAQTAKIIFPQGSGLPVNLVDAQSGSVLQNDYAWIIEEDVTLHNGTPGVTPPIVSGTPQPSLATSFYRSHMPVVAAGCTGSLSCRDAQAFGGKVATTLWPRSLPSHVALDPAKWYFLSILPGDSANPFIGGIGTDPLLNPACLIPKTVGGNDAACGHSMSGTSIPPLSGASYAVSTVKVEPNPLKPAQLSIYIFEDNSPTNGDPDTNEHGLGGFNIVIFDTAGRSGDVIGQMSYDVFNNPLTNALLGTPGCPNTYSPTPSAAPATVPSPVPPGLPVINPSYAGKDLTGVIITCPNDPVNIDNPTAEYSLQGQALVKNLMPGRFDVVAHPSAARQGAGEIWYQTSTLEGGAGQDVFTKSGEPAFFQEFGPPGFHTFIGFLNPATVAKQNTYATHVGGTTAAAGPDADQVPLSGSVALATTTVSGRITSLHMSRPVMETLWDSGSRAPLAATTCLVGLNQVGETGLNIGFSACDANGNFKLTNVPVGSYLLVIWDQWLDQIIAYKSLQVNGKTAPDVNGNPVPVGPVAMGNIPVFSWFSRVETSVFLDSNGNGKRDVNEPPVSGVPVRIRFRDGSVSNTLLTDSNGNAIFSELFPLFNWYVMESDRTRFVGTGVNVTVDAGGLPDCVTYNPATGQGTVVGTNQNSNLPCAKSGGILNSSYVWKNPVTGANFGSVPTGTVASTNRIDAGSTLYEGLQGFINQTEILDWGKRPFHAGENGGIQGMVVYASTRGFDDPTLEVQFMWEPGVPRVNINLYKEITNPDGTLGLTLVNTTKTTSWDDFAHGTTAAGKPNMVCPGQDATDPFLTYTLGMANQFKCYDGFHLWNQVQPAVYDGAYTFTTDAAGHTLLPGKYIVEMIPPPGYEVVKEEDKNILIGDAFVTPVAQQFGALSNIYILPDQAQIAAYYNPNNPNNATTTLGFQGAKVKFPTCVGSTRTVPDFMSLFPNSGQVAPFAGAIKALCDRKEVTLADQMTATASFFVFSNTPVAAHFTGLILNDAATEINAASPDFGEKFAVAYAPISLRDINGVEISRIYSDQWGTYNGMAPSTWQVNVPNPAGYSPNMLITCMNDPGPIVDTRVGSTTLGQMIPDPLFNPSFSNFCYTLPFMPGATSILDTPVLPVAAFADGYNPPDCSYANSTPAIKRVDSSDGIGPWVAAADGLHTLTITSLGDTDVPNPAYEGPSASTAPFNQRTARRHYGFGTATGTVSINGVPLTNVSWSDGAITGTVAFGTRTGELMITSAAGLSSVDTVTVTVGGPAPVVVKPVAYAPGSGPGYSQPLQNAIDTAKPGDLIIVDAGTYPELVIMWKPVRLQGVGAASVVINAAKYPTHKLEDWRERINKLFGVNKTIGGSNTAAGQVVDNPQIDPLPTQKPITGGVIRLEPTILATEEGAGITVLGKNIGGGDQAGLAQDGTGETPGLPATPCNVPLGGSFFFSATATNNGVVSSVVQLPTGWDMGDSNFRCGESRIDGLSITGSDTGGGIYVNGWAHGLEIANNRIYSNASSMHGGLRVGSPFEEEIAGSPGDGYGYDNDVKIHHNAITKNGTIEATPGVGSINGTASGAGISICTGSDNYAINYNFICGNFSNGNGGGIGAIGVNMNGLISHNQILFNQSWQQSANTHGGGIDIEGDLTPVANFTAFTTGEGGAGGGLPIVSYGTGNITIDSNLIAGNFAQAGHGGGIRLQQINGDDVVSNPSNPDKWYRATVTNNVIARNVAGWSGGGISLVDTLNASVRGNTIASNDSSAIVGALFGTGGRGPTTAYPSPAGISTEMTTATLLAVLPTVVSSTTPRAATKAHNTYSNPTMINDIVWHNRSFFVDAKTGVANVCSSNNVANVAATCVVLPVPVTAGGCTGTPAYWDVGTVGDASAAASNFKLTNFTQSIVSPAGSIYSLGSLNPTITTIDPGFVKLDCNGSRANPALKFEPGQPFLPPFSMAAGITLDEAGNFVDLKYGPLSLADPLQPGVVPYGNYHLLASNSAFNTGVGAYAATAALGTLTPDVILSPLACGTAANPTCGNATVQLQNTGTGTLSITAINATTGFTVAHTCGISLAAGAVCTITVTYHATSPAGVTGTLTVRDNSNNRPNQIQTLPLRGAIP